MGRTSMTSLHFDAFLDIDKECFFDFGVVAG